MSISRHQLSEEIIDEWKQRSKTKLKEKMEENITQRAPQLQLSINTSIHIITSQLSSISPSDWHNINNIPSFQIPESLINNAKNALFEEVYKWTGVDISAKHKPPTSWDQYHKTADNWWNRYKAKWLGDQYFYPLIKTILMKYCIMIINKHYNGDSDKQSIINIVYFNALSNTMHSEITFNRTRAQPLILDQSFKKSKTMKNLFICMGEQFGIKWDLDVKSFIYP